MTVAPAKPLDDVLEREYEHQLIGTRTKPGVARMLGWRCYHTLRSKGSEAGYPDWTLVRDRVLFLEVKRERGRLTPEQKTWVRALLAAGAEVYVVRPHDLDAIGRILAHRGDPLHARGPAADAATRLRNATREETTT